MRILNTLLSFLVLALISMPGFTVTDEAVKHFAKGKILIEKNCGDCMNSSRKGLEEGLSELGLADSKGYEDKAAMYKLMYQAYGAIAFVFVLPDSEDSKKYKILRQQIAEKLVALLPEDSEILYEYAGGLQDKNEQLKLLQKVLHLNPKNFGARLKVGLRLVEIGQIDQAMVQLKQVVNEADPPYVADVYRDVAIEKLNEFGYKDKAAELLKQASPQQRH